MTEAPRVLYTTRRDATPEAELSALVAVYKFVLSQTSKGGPLDLTGETTKECTTRPDKKGMQNADLHGN